MACANSGSECVVKSTHTHRGPKKGYSKELQKEIGI